MADRNIVQELRLLGSIECPYGCDEVGNPAADAIEQLTAERDASRLIISDLTAEVERLEKRLQACQSNDDYALTDDCITQNEQFLLAENKRLRAERDAERQHADRLAEVLRIVVRDWCPSSTRVPILNEHEARREQ